VITCPGPPSSASDYEAQIITVAEDIPLPQAGGKALIRMDYPHAPAICGVHVQYKTYPYYPKTILYPLFLGKHPQFFM